MELRKGIANMGMNDIVAENNDADHDEILIYGQEEKIRDKNVQKNAKFNYNDEFEFADEELEMLVDKVMQRFQSLAISGKLLLEMKHNTKFAKKFETIMSESSVEYWPVCYFKSYCFS